MPSCLHDLHKRVKAYGVKVVNFQITDVGYEDNMAESLLAKQKAHANLISRGVFARGVADILMETIGALEEKGLVLDDQAKGDAATNLLLILSNHQGTTNLFVGCNPQRLLEDK